MDKYHVLMQLGADEWWPIAPRFGKPYVFTKKEAEEYIAQWPGCASRYKIEPVKEVTVDQYHVFVCKGEEAVYRPITRKAIYEEEPYTFTKREAEEYIAARPGLMAMMRKVK